MHIYPLDNITAGPKGGNLYECKSITLQIGIVTLIGPPLTPYSDGVFFLDIDFPNDYPIKPPQLTFRTRIYHCNINSSGNIALNLLDLWYPAMGIRQVLQAVSSLLINANLCKLYRIHSR
jgi:ubiquitin-protein ligase